MDKITKRGNMNFHCSPLIIREMDISSVKFKMDVFPVRVEFSLEMMKMVYSLKDGGTMTNH